MLEDLIFKNDDNEKIDENIKNRAIELWLKICQSNEIRLERMTKLLKYNNAEILNYNVLPYVLNTQQKWIGLFVSTLYLNPKLVLMGFPYST